MGADAAPVWSAYARRVPVGDWSTAAYAITRYRAFARAALRRKGVPLAGALAAPVAAALLLKDALTAKALPDGPAGPSSSARLDGFDARFDAFWRELVAQNPATVAGRPRRRGSAVALRRSRCGRGGCGSSPPLRDGLIRAYCVLKQHHLPPGVRSMKIVDFQTRRARHGPAARPA